MKQYSLVVVRERGFAETIVSVMAPDLREAREMFESIGFEGNCEVIKVEAMGEIMDRVGKHFIVEE
jgi:hypothetical protein